MLSAQKEAAAPWNRLYFPEEASHHAVNDLLYKRFQETLGEQDRAIHEQKTHEMHTHNIAVTAEVPVAELKQVIESLAPKVASPPAQVLQEAAAQQMRAENMRMQAEIQATLEAHQLEMKKHATAAENAARLAEIHKQTPHQQVVEKIIEKHHAPVTHIYDQRTTYNGGRDARQVFDNSQTLNIDARTEQ